jgi:hypothetical protein
MQKAGTAILFVLCAVAAWGQDPQPVSEGIRRQLHIRPASSTIFIDGIPDETAWTTASVADGFYNNFPDDTSKAKSPTEVRVTYDDHNLYIMAKCFDKLPGNYVVQSLRRDFSYPISDAFSVVLDPFNDHLNGFSFGVNPLGAQREGLIAVGGGQGVSTDWDNLWYAETHRFDDYWCVEMAIPFRTIRFKANISHWGINFTRNDLKRNESSTWSRVPRIFNIATLAFTGEMTWDRQPEKRGAAISLIPYATAGINRDYTKQGSTAQPHNGGLDAKVAVSSALNLDLTVNPDFSQVEVDRQQTNLTRFDLFFPERRNFFIENSDLFASFGFRQIRPFFSRRIGLASGNLVPILGGFRLSGKPNQQWRIGLMNLQTEGGRTWAPLSENYTVAAVQRILWKRSNISALVVNRIPLGNRVNPSTYNTVVGADFNLASADNKWNGKAFYHHNLTDKHLPDAYAHATWLSHSVRNYSVDWNHEYVGKNYDPAVGFVPRNKLFDPIASKTNRISYWRLEPGAGWNFYPGHSRINNHGPNVYADLYWTGEGQSTDRLLRGGWEFNFQNSAYLSVNATHYYTYLLFPANLTGKAGGLLPVGAYNYNNGMISFVTNKRKLTTLNINADAGTFFNGNKVSISVEGTRRIQPYAILSLAAGYNYVTLNGVSTKLWLISPRFDFTFTRAVFLTTFLQYNTQLNNFNINTRLQWRFRPMSDLFLVYTDNYRTGTGETINFNGLAISNRAIVLKFIYWLNV